MPSADDEDLSLAEEELSPSRTRSKSNSNLNECDPRGDLTLVASKKEHDGPSKVFLVCSRTLARISPVFDRMLYGSMAESQSKNPTNWTVNLPEDDPKTLELLLHICHGKWQNVPNLLSIDDLFSLTMLTHYYDATHILSPWTPTWLASLPQPPSTDEIHLYKLLWISQELGARYTFEVTAHRLIMECPGTTPHADLTSALSGALPDLITRIDDIRPRTIHAMLTLYANLLDLLTVVDEKPRWCRHASYMGPHRCESMILGSMTFCLTRAGLWPVPEAEEVRDSVAGLHRALSGLVIHDIGRVGKEGVDHGACNPRGFLRERLQRIVADMEDPLGEEDRKRVEAQGRKMGGGAGVEQGKEAC
ncbi:hypothetical protein B9Z65_3868 [Elsinoe australis]|uniref:BTB domain-containing protein n=1 Tax=Elsinoe australis TaxID=40998 RepID=A0A2P8A2T3_9PEZI|nr:hypothetical protein B9Z65_3868 [Elsinoe australis]